jgi:hypothetical protein
MKIIIAGVIIISSSFIIALYQRYKGLFFWTSFIKSVIALSGVIATIWKLI